MNASGWAGGECSQHVRRDSAHEFGGLLVVPLGFVEREDPGDRAGGEHTRSACGRVVRHCVVVKTIDELHRVGRENFESLGLVLGQTETIGLDGDQTLEACSVAYLDALEHPVGRVDDAE